MATWSCRVIHNDAGETSHALVLVIQSSWSSIAHFVYVGACTIFPLYARPCLQQTLFPNDPTFDALEHRWKDENALCFEYLVLCRRVRQAMAQHRRSIAGADSLVPPEVEAHVATWSSVVKYTVLPIGVCVLAWPPRCLAIGWSMIVGIMTVFSKQCPLFLDLWGCATGRRCPAVPDITCDAVRSRRNAAGTTAPPACLRSDFPHW